MTTSGRRDLAVHRQPQRGRRDKDKPLRRFCRTPPERTYSRVGQGGRTRGRVRRNLLRQRPGRPEAGQTYFLDFTSTNPRSLHCRCHRATPIQTGRCMRTDFTALPQVRLCVPDTRRGAGRHPRAGYACAPSRRLRRRWARTAQVEELSTVARRAAVAWPSPPAVSTRRPSTRFGYPFAALAPRLT